MFETILGLSLLLNLAMSFEIFKLQKRVNEINKYVKDEYHGIPYLMKSFSELHISKREDDMKIKALGKYLGIMFVSSSKMDDKWVQDDRVKSTRLLDIDSLMYQGDGQYQWEKKK